jgi:hypothetical protein
MFVNFQVLSIFWEKKNPAIVHSQSGETTSNCETMVYTNSA